MQNIWNLLIVPDVIQVQIPSHVFFLFSVLWPHKSRHTFYLYASKFLKYRCEIVIVFIMSSFKMLYVFYLFIL